MISNLYFSRLALGHVNEYGVFNSEMEPEPQTDASSGEHSFHIYLNKCINYTLFVYIYIKRQHQAVMS